MIGNILKVIAALIKGCLVGLLFGSAIGILLGLPLSFFFREIVSSNQDVPLRMLISTILGGLLGFSEVQIFNKKLFAADEHPLIGVLVGAVFGLIFGGLVNNVMVVLSSDSSNQDFYIAGLEYSGALGVRIGAIMYSFFGAAEAVREIVKHQQDVMKRFLVTSLPPVVILTIICTLVIRGEVSQAYTVCKNRMLSVEGQGTWIYQRTELNINYGSIPSIHGKTGIIFVFSDGCGDAYCSVYRDLSGWHENEGVWYWGVACLP